MKEKTLSRRNCIFDQKNRWKSMSGQNDKFVP